MNGKKLLISIALVFGALATTTVLAEAPAGSTGECKDGTYTSAKSKRGACAAHGGVKTWFEEKKAAAESPKAAKEAPKAAKESSKAATRESPKATAPSAATEAPAKTATSTPRAEPKSTAKASEPAAGGGDGKVWVNTPSKVYHCSGDRWYGKTRKGEYMSEADARAQGYRASRGKACS